MNPSKRHIGLALTVVGALTLAVSYIAGWTNYNAVLLLGLGLVVAGVVLHVAVLKSESKY